MIEENQKIIREKFRTFTTNDDKWEYLIALAKNHIEPEGLDKSGEYIIPGCTTTMYLVPKYNLIVINICRNQLVTCVISTDVDPCFFSRCNSCIFCRNV